MLDHLLPLIYRDYEYFDEANKENYGYMIRRRVRPVSTRVSTPSWTPPRPPRRTLNSLKIDGGVASNCRLKRRREASEDDGNKEERDAKKQHTRSAVKDNEPIAKKKQVQPHAVNQHEVQEDQRQMEPVTPLQKMQQSTISAKKAPKKSKTSKTSKKKKVTMVDSMQKKVVKVSKSATTPKRIPLQDITHLYVNEHTRSYTYQLRERFVAGLSTSVAIRFF